MISGFESTFFTLFIMYICSYMVCVIYDLPFRKEFD